MLTLIPVFFGWALSICMILPVDSEVTAKNTCMQMKAIETGVLFFYSICNIVPQIHFNTVIQIIFKLFIL